MKKHLSLILAGLIAVSLSAGCSKEEAPKTAEQPKPATVRRRTSGRRRQSSVRPGR